MSQIIIFLIKQSWSITKLVLLSWIKKEWSGINLLGRAKLTLLTPTQVSSSTTVRFPDTKGVQNEKELENVELFNTDYTTDNNRSINSHASCEIKLEK